MLSFLTPRRAGSWVMMSSTALIGGATLALACTSSDLNTTPDPPDVTPTASITVDSSGGARSAPEVQGLTLLPSSATLTPGQSVQFTPVGWRAGGGDPVLAAVTWSATGGTITKDGLYTAGGTLGSFAVTAKLVGGWNTESAPITIKSDNITKVNLTPASVTLAPGGVQQFATSAVLQDGTVQSSPYVTWWASGGTVSSSGRYTAPTTTGSYRVVIRSSNGLKDTSNVTVGTTTTITSVSVNPASATVATGATAQFTASATRSDGSTQSNPPVAWTATGGTISSTGLYTAGSTVGTYRVVASANGHADTSGVSVTSTVTSPTPTGNSLYFNSGEKGCGTDSSVVWCDDFEDGDWYSKNCDVANSTGGLLQTDGWCGTIYADSYIATNLRCGTGAGAAGTRCAAYSGTLPGPNPDYTGNMGDHNLGPSGNSYSDLYFRWYIRYSTDHSLNPQKTLTVNSTRAGSGGITIGGFGNGAGWASMCPVYDCQTLSAPNPQNPGCSNGVLYYLCQNQGTPLSWSSVLGHWVYMEMHVRMNTPGQRDGVFELWMNDCGTGGVCSGSPVLRSRYTNVQWQGPSDNRLITSFWVENQSPPAPDGPTRGSESYDQIKVSRAGPIGFSQ